MNNLAQFTGTGRNSAGAGQLALMPIARREHHAGFTECLGDLALLSTVVTILLRPHRMIGQLPDARGL
jgi:hypothetical protein